VRRPTDIRQDILWYREECPGGVFAFAEVNPERNWPPCKVYWTSHGCGRPKGHDGPHWCDCCDCADHPDHDSGCVAGPPYYGDATNFYGEDA
jgi:hypothetical protein